MLKQNITSLLLTFLVFEVNNGWANPQPDSFSASEKQLIDQQWINQQERQKALHVQQAATPPDISLLPKTDNNRLSLVFEPESPCFDIQRIDLIDAHHLP